MWLENRNTLVFDELGINDKIREILKSLVHLRAIEF